MRGRDFRGRGTVTTITLHGQTIPLCFCFLSFSIAEDVYSDVFKCDGDIADILDKLAENDINALLSVAYGAMSAANEKGLLKDMLSLINTGADVAQLRYVIITNVTRMFRKNIGQGYVPETRLPEFQWDIYYRNALFLGMSEDEFWNATPRKLWLLTRDKEAEEHSVEMTNQYI